jgi:TetR/AcrR family transcriptional regulator, regulator of cefoperazone and chloramphenicol sensitivity
MTRIVSASPSRPADVGHGDRETRDRLLKAAERLFAQRGFKDVTVREICHEAHANVAAVNYHFGDKLGLYRETMQIAIDAMRDATEAARRAGEGMKPDEQLRAYVGLFLRRLLAPGHESVYQLVNREISDPTPALDDLIEKGMRPRLEYLSGVVAGIIGCELTDKRVMRCVLSVQSQSIIYARPNAVAERLGFKFRPTPAQIDEAARHIADFSIAGIRAIGQGAANL